MSVVVPLFKAKGDAMSCGAYRGVKSPERAMTVQNILYLFAPFFNLFRL